MILSKSDYMLFLRHPAWLWLKKFDKTKLPPVDANLQAMFDTGHEFETYAEKLFPDATRLGFDSYQEYLSLTQRTTDALNEGAETIFQGRFETEGLTCIVDVLQRVENDKDNTYDLIEIKSSTRAKPEHEYDLAFQTVVLEKAGLHIRNISVVHVNKEYIRDVDIKPEELTTQTNITESVRALIDTTEDQISKAREILFHPDSMPSLSPRLANQLNVSGVEWFAEWADIYKSLHPELDQYSIYNISYPSPEQIGKLEDDEITTISDIPEDQALRPKQLTQIQTTRDDKRIIEADNIKEFLDTFTFPLYFFDYETFSSVVPDFDGCKPYGDYPFQYSLHLLDSPDAELKHLEYLHSDNSNPMPQLIKQLEQNVGESGTILTWNMSYEKGCNDRIAEIYPEHKDFLDSINGRINDLMIPFSKMWFVDKDFFGSASIKNVMPVLAPELSYKELEVSDGLLARRTWTETVLKGQNPEQKDQILSDLSKYCTLDTYAMVRIYEELLKI